MIRLTLLLIAVSSSALGATPLVTYPASFPSSVVHAAATDGAGNLYVTGTAYFGNGHTGFPVTPGAFQATFGSRQRLPSFSGVPKCVDAFVAKFKADGSLAYATYLGGSGDDEGFAIAVDATGNAWVTGYTTSTDFPITPNALQKTNAGGTVFISPTSPPPYQGDAFITGVNVSGSALIYSSFFGGTGADAGNSIAVDAQGNVYFAGDGSSGVATTTGSSACAGGFVAKVNPRTPAVVYSSCLTPGVQAMAIDSAGSAYVIGSVSSGAQFSPTPGAFQTTFAGGFVAFVAKISSDGSRFDYATLLGINTNAKSIAVDASGSAWIVGTAPPGFPGSPPPPPNQTEGFVARLNPTGSNLVLSALMAGGAANSVLLDQSGNAYVSGTATSPTFATMPEATESTACAGVAWFITKWSPQGDLLYSSYSREGPAVAIDTSGNLYLSSYTHISDVLGSAPSVVRYNPAADQRQGSIGCVTNAASFAGGYVSPGEIITLWGDRLGPDQPAQLQLDPTGKVSTNVGNTRVLFNGAPAPILYADAHQINAIVPWGIAPLQSVNLTVEYAGVSSLPMTVYNNTSTPGIFLANPSQPGSQGAILNEDGSVNSSSNPAARGSIISIFCTGMGLVSPLPQDGTVMADTTHLLATPVPVLFPGPDNPCAFDGKGGTPSCTEGQIIYEGAAPTLVAGVIQINVRLPASLPDYLTLPGPVPIKMRIPNGPISPVLATVAVQ